MAPKRRKVPKTIDEDTQRDFYSLIATSGLTYSALATVLQKIRSSPKLADAPGGRSTIECIASARFDAIEHVERVQLTDGRHFDWSIAHPGLLMQLVIEESGALQELFARGLRRHPNSKNSPWSCCIGFDEFSPGDKLKVDNARKVMVVSFSFLELGSAIRSEFGWFTGSVVRSSIIHQATGGWSAMMRQYLHVHLLGANGMSEAGVAITIHGQPLLFWAKLTNLLSDGDGHKQCLSWKAAAGIKPCFFAIRIWRAVGKALWTSAVPTHPSSSATRVLMWQRSWI